MSGFVNTNLEGETYDCTEEVLEKTLSTIVETRGTIGEVRVIKVVESLPDLDRCLDIDLYISIEV